MSRRRLALAYCAVAAAGAILGGLALWGPAAPDGRSCARPAAPATSTGAVYETTLLFVRDVLMRRDPGCGGELATRRLRPALAKLPPFLTRYPLVPYARARADSARTQAVYVVSRRVRTIVTVDERGRTVAPLSIGLAAPDAGAAAYNLVLRLEGGSWRVDSVRRVRL